MFVGNSMLTVDGQWRLILLARMLRNLDLRNKINQTGVFKMNKRDAARIIKKEGLNRRNFFPIFTSNPGEAVIIADDKGFQVFMTGERGEKEGLRHYELLDDALTDYIDRLRSEKKLKEYFNE